MPEHDNDVEHGEDQGYTIAIDALPEDLRSVESIRKFAQDGKVSIPNALKSYVELEKMLGNSIRVPGENATNEEKTRFRRQLGVPDSPDDYQLPSTDENKEIITAFAKAAHEAGMTKAQAEHLITWWNTVAEQTMEQQKAHIAKVTTDLKNQYGQAYDQVISDAKKALVAFGTDNLRQRIEAGDPIGNDPDVIATFINISRGMSEGRYVKADALMNTKENIQARIVEITSDPAYFDTTSPKYLALREEREALYRKLYPGK